MKEYSTGDTPAVWKVIRIKGQAGFFQVVEKFGCAGCAFVPDFCRKHKPHCSRLNRPDGKSVQFHKYEFAPGTVGYELNRLPEPYRTQAIENTKLKMMLLKVGGTASALRNAFVWKNSPQKSIYWVEFYFKTIGLGEPESPVVKPPQKPPKKRKSRAFVITGKIESGTQVSPTYKLVKRVETLNELADVFEKHTAVFIQSPFKGNSHVKNTGYVRFMPFSEIVKQCKDGRIWIVEPVNSITTPSQNIEVAEKQ